MRYLLFVIGLSLLSIEGKSQEIDNITGQTIDQKRITMPADVKGKYTLLCFASSTKAQKDLETWLDPVYQKFIAKTGIMDDMYDVNVFFIPLVKGSNQMFAENMTSGEIPYLFLLDKDARIIYRTNGGYTEDKFDRIDELIE